MRIKARPIFTIICVLIVIPMLSVSALAYETNGNKIYDPITFIPNSQFGTTSRSHMRAAVGKWNSAAGSAKCQFLLQHTLKRQAILVAMIIVTFIASIQEPLITLHNVHLIEICLVIFTKQI